MNNFKENENEQKYQTENQKEKELKFYSSSNLNKFDKEIKNEFLLDAPKIFITKADNGSHFEFLVLKDAILIEFNFRLYEKLSMKKDALFDYKDSVKNIGFEDLNYIEEKYNEITQFSLKT